MEFLEYDNVRDVLKGLEVTEAPDGDRMLFGLQDKDGVVHGLYIGPADGDAPEGYERSEAPKDKLGELVEEILTRLHIGEAALVPAKNWRAVLDLAAFDLAQDEMWQDIDAEAAMHQTNRDPLVLGPEARPLAGTIVKALCEHADAPDHELTITSLDAPIVMTVRHTGSLEVLCPNAAVRQRVGKAV